MILVVFSCIFMHFPVSRSTCIVLWFMLLMGSYLAMRILSFFSSLSLLSFHGKCNMCNMASTSDQDLLTTNFAGLSYLGGQFFLASLARNAERHFIHLTTSGKYFWDSTMQGAGKGQYKEPFLTQRQLCKWFETAHLVHRVVNFSFLWTQKSVPRFPYQTWTYEVLRCRMLHIGGEAGLKVLARGPIGDRCEALWSMM